LAIIKDEMNSLIETTWTCGSISAKGFPSLSQRIFIGGSIHMLGKEKKDKYWLSNCENKCYISIKCLEICV
jgi:hypothetical protein